MTSNFGLANKNKENPGINLFILFLLKLLQISILPVDKYFKKSIRKMVNLHNISKRVDTCVVTDIF